MLHLPKNREVLWNGIELKKMTNLKMLSIENADFSRGPEFLPSSLRVLKWRGYPTQSLPPEYDPRRLVMLDLSLSRSILCKQLNLMLKSYNGGLESVYGEDGWNHLEVSYVGPRAFPHSCRTKKGTIKWMGVHVYKNKTNMQDIRFINPWCPKRAFSELSKPDLEESFQSLPKRIRVSQRKEICEAPRTKQHQAKRGYHGVSQRLWLAICSIVAPPDVKVLMWNICRDDLPTFEYLFRRKLVISPLCPICGTEPETVEHVFLFCPWTRPLWFGSDFQWRVDVKEVQSFQLWLWHKLMEIQRVYPENANQISAQVGSICWSIWKGRNEFVLEGKPVDPLILR
ncbi:hypothetical protein ACSQ67_003844 [Phaseolus vulgaris]